MDPPEANLLAKLAYKKKEERKKASSATKSSFL